MCPVLLDTSWLLPEATQLASGGSVDLNHCGALSTYMRPRGLPELDPLKSGGSLIGEGERERERAILISLSPLPLPLQPVEGAAVLRGLAQVHHCHFYLINE